MNTLLPAPAPGVYTNIPFDTYCRWDAANHTCLKRVALSPAHYRHARDNPAESDTPSKRFGRAAHQLVLEPASFERCYVPAPINPSTCNPYGPQTKAWAEYAAEHAGKLILTEEEIDRLQTVVKALASHDTAGPLLKAPGLSEASVVWQDESGVLCKARFDRIVRNWGWLDIKTCECASIQAFETALVDYGYITQAALYDRARMALGIEARQVFIAVESEPPHGVGVFEVHEDVLAIGRKLVAEWLGKVARCQQQGAWPGYPTDVQQALAPHWWIKRYGDDQI